MADVTVVIGRDTDGEVDITYHDDGSFTVTHPNAGRLVEWDWTGDDIDVVVDSTLGDVTGLLRNELRRLLVGLSREELNPQPLPP
jgi:hypothetical protein